MSAKSVETWGYSEQGVINALFYEMSLPKDSLPSSIC